MARVFDTRKGDRHKNLEQRRAYMAEYMRERRNSVLRAGLPFAGTDGEGGGEKGSVHPGYHAYFLLSAGRTAIRPLPGNVRITTMQALEYISQLPTDKTYVGYFFDYDVTKILEDLPLQKLERLMKRDLRVRKDGFGIFPLDFGPYEIDYIPRKEFKVRKGTGPWVVINDVGPFFQCKFVEALEKWNIGTSDQLALIRKGKDMRGNFSINDVEEIAEYNRMEIVLLEQLMEEFRKACTEVGLVPAKWQGPGQLAKALMKKNGVPRTRDVPLLNDPEFYDLLVYGRNAYYGGRPELSAIGPVNQPVWQWDINSAYPWAMLSVPCLMHGGWEKEEYVGGMDASKIDADYSLVYGTFKRKPVYGNDKATMWNGLPFRKSDGTICYPGSGTGWYWNFEIAASTHQSFRAKSAWIYRRQCDCKPLQFVSDVYRQRLDMGKDGPGIVLKLALNSLYGICVQSIGKPEYANPVWGSFITAMCRTKIQEFIHSSPLCAKGICGRDILMIATDSVATITPRPDMTDSTELGGWSKEEHSRGMFLIQPGLYFGSSGKHAKTRGVPLAVVEEKEQEFRSAFDRMAVSKRLEDGDVRVPQTMFVGIRYALHRRNLKLMGQWIRFSEDEADPEKHGKVIRFDWTTKREPYPIIEPNRFHSYIETFPILGATTNETVPYSKDIGGIESRENERLILEAMPDWQATITPGEMS